MDTPWVQTSVSRAYHYLPLKNNIHEIRVIVIPPAEWVSELRCRLFHVSLDHNPSYEALSYTWGDQTSKHIITLDGAEIEISRALTVALRGIQYPNRPRTVWIDALCINQANDEEKSIQVQMMRRVYQQASRVIIWLGLRSTDSSLALSFLQSLHDEVEEDSLDLSTELLKRWLREKCRPAYDAHWASLFNLMHREYWRRLWIVQEIVSAREIIVYCGDDTMEWQSLVYITNLIESTIEELGTDTQWSAASQMSWPPVKLDNLKKNFTHAWLYNLLAASQARECTDPKDKLYALLGIVDVPGVPNHVLKDIIDYGKSQQAVYIDAVKLCSHYADFGYGPLTVICRSNSHKVRVNWPSWVPDFSLSCDYNALQAIYHNTLPRHLDGTFLEGTVFASGNYPIGHKLNINGTILVASGVTVDSIHLVPEPYFEVGVENVERFTWEELEEYHKPGLADTYLRFLATFQCWKDLALHAERGMPHSSRDSSLLLEDFWRTVCCNHDYGIATISDFTAPCQRIIDENPPENTGDLNFQDWSPLDHLFRVTVASHSHHRKFVVSLTGIFCLGPSTAKEGDLICVLVGCDFPVLLRPYGDGHVLVGECYVHGYMHGKAMDELAEGKHEMKGFRIH
ncbi:hypothetical protein B7463_g9465, partial [Scytalidium lignicola]